MQPESFRPPIPSTLLDSGQCLGLHVFLGDQVVLAFTQEGVSVAERVAFVRVLSRLPEFEGCHLLVCRRSSRVNYLPMVTP